MSSSKDKWEDSHIFWEQGEPIKRINNFLTSLEAVNIVNRLSLYAKDNEELLKKAETLKEWLKSK